MPVFDHKPESQLAAPQQGGLRVKYSLAAAFFVGFFFWGKADTILLGGCGKSKWGLIPSTNQYDVTADHKCSWCNYLELTKEGLYSRKHVLWSVHNVLWGLLTFFPSVNTPNSLICLLKYKLLGRCSNATKPRQFIQSSINKLPLQRYKETQPVLLSAASTGNSCAFMIAFGICCSRNSTSSGLSLAAHNSFSVHSSKAYTSF